MKIRTRLFVVLSLLGALVAVTAVTAVTAFAELGGSVAGVVRDNVRSVETCAAMNHALGLHDRGFLLLLAGRAEPGGEAIREGAGRFADALGRARENITLPGETDAIDKIEASHRRFTDAVERFRSAPPPAPGTAAAHDIADYVAVARPYLDDVAANVAVVAEMNRAGIDTAAAEARRSGWRSSAWVLAVGALGVCLAVVLGRRLYRSIADPLDRVSRSIVAVGGGDLSRRVPYHARDELGSIAAAVNAMVERLAALETSREGQLRLAQRTAGSILDSLRHPALVVDRSRNTVLVSRRAREMLGDDPIAALRAGARGIAAPGEIDRRLADALDRRVAETPEGPATPLVVLPILGPAGSVLGAVVFVDAPAALTAAAQP